MFGGSHDWILDDIGDDLDDLDEGVEGAGTGVGGCDDDSDDECLDNKVCTYVGTQKEFTNQVWPLKRFFPLFPFHFSIRFNGSSDQ